MTTQEHLRVFVEQFPKKQDAAKKLGMSPASLSMYLHGKVNPGALIRERLRDAGYSIGDERLGWSGLIDPPPMMSLTDAAPDMLIPMMLSSVAAGEPKQVYDDVGAYFNPSKMFKHDSRLIQSVGDSMTGAGISEGDWLLVDTEIRATDRQIVVARVADKLTVKRLKTNGDEWLLHPENPDFTPIKIVGGEVEILGVVVWSGRFHSRI